MYGEILALMAALSFSGAALLYRAGVKNSDVHPLVLSGFRGAFALMFMLALSRFYPVGLFKPFIFLLAAAVSTVASFVLGDSAFLYGLQRAPVGVVYPVAYTFSIFTALFSHFLLNENITLKDALAAVFVISGVLFVYGGSCISGAGGLIGIVAGLMASVFWGLGVSTMGFALNWGNPVEINISRLALLVLITSPLIVKDKEKLKRQVRLTYLALGGVLGIGIGPLLFMRAIEFIGASRSSIFISSTPALTVVLSRVFLRERTTGKLLLGSVLVSLGLLFESIG
ncbi:MAG: DMT family transporter [Thermofilum sp.]|nr:DMT family transporter [Thermofilum sp.]